MCELRMELVPGIEYYTIEVEAATIVQRSDS